jgi:hypothetical protein
MCDDGVSAPAADGRIRQEVEAYAESNGVVNPANNVEAYYVQFADTEVVLMTDTVGGGMLPDGAAGVVVRTNIERRMSLMQLIGIETASAQATATGITGPPLTGGGLRPIGVPDEMIGDLGPGGVFTVDVDRGDIVWATGSSQLRGWLNLWHLWNTHPDLDEEAQGWPRVRDCPGGSCKQLLEEWMADGFDGAVYGGDWVHSLPGATTAQICKAPENEIIFLPIYDENGGYECDNVPDPKPECPTASGYVFHIVGFVGAEITECLKAPDKIITMKIVEVIRGEGVPAPNQGYGGNICETTGIWVVSLWQ